MPFATNDCVAAEGGSMKNLSRAFRHVPVLLLVMIGIASAGPKKPVTLTPPEEDMAKKAGFERQVLLLVKEEIGEDHIHRLTGYNEEGYQIVSTGVSISVPEDKTDLMLSLLKKKIRPLKHMAFVVETNEGIKTDKIGILKGTDQYEILRLMQTNGTGYGITNDDIIEKLKAWDKCYPFEIIGANYEWVEIEFKTLPRDLKAFADEVGEFCPDAIDGGATGTDEFAKDLKKTKKLLLWWEP
jgi:hypothetical protein